MIDDRRRRRPMIMGCYAATGVLLTVTGALVLRQASLGATSHTLVWTMMFFFASANGSAGYLTVSEVFPMPSSMTCDRAAPLTMIKQQSGTSA